MVTKQPITIKGVMASVTTLLPSEHVLINLVTTGDEEVRVLVDKAKLVEGENFEATGSYSRHHPYARIFIPTDYRSFPRSGLGQQARYIAQGLGCPIEAANAILAQWGEDALHVLDTEPERLAEINGLHEGDIERYRQQWIRHRDDSDNTALYAALELSASAITRLRHRLGWSKEQFNKQLRENPFLGYIYLPEASFDAAKRRAELLEWSGNDERWMQAFAIKSLRAAEIFGHSYVEQDQLIARIRRMLQQRFEAKEIQQALQELESVSAISRHRDRYYLNYLLNAELNAQSELRRLLSSSSELDCPQDPSGLIDHVSERFKFDFSVEEYQAIRYAIKHKCTVFNYPVFAGPERLAAVIAEAALALHGEPVIGCVNPDLVAWFQNHAPHLRCEHIADLLDMDEIGEPARYKDSPIQAEMVIMLDAGLLDIQRFALLLSALADKASLCLIGDEFAVNTMGAGRPFIDLLGAKAVPSRHLCPAHLTGPSAVMQEWLAAPVGTKLQSSKALWHIKVDAGDLADTCEYVLSSVFKKLGISNASDFCLLTPTRNAVPDGRALVKLHEAYFKSSERQPFADTRLFNGQYLCPKQTIWQPFWPVGYRAPIGSIDSIQRFTIELGGKHVSIDAKHMERLQSAQVLVPYGMGCIQSDVVVLLLPVSANQNLLHRQLLYQAAASAKKTLIILDEGNRIEHAHRCNPPSVFSGFAFMLLEDEREI